MAKHAGSLQERAQLIRQNDYLPQSFILHHPVDKNGRVVLNSENSIRFSDTRDNITTNNVHEKNRPDQVGVLLPGTEFYQRNFVAPKSNSAVIASSALDIYPLNGQKQNAIVHMTAQPYTGAGIVNYEHLMTQDGLDVPIVRLQELLISLGLKSDIDCFYDLQTVLKNETIRSLFTVRGLDQLALSTYFIPNAIGETDVNSRNVLVVMDPITGKYDSIIRIDADKTLTMFEKKPDKKLIIPKGIFKLGQLTENASGESYDDFLMFIHHHKSMSEIDWDLFAGYFELSKYFLSDKDIERGVFKSYEANQGRCCYGYTQPMDDRIFGAFPLMIQNYEDFIKNIKSRVHELYGDISQRISGVSGRLVSEGAGFLEIDKFKTRLFDKNGRPISANDTPQGPIF